jgi:hypothetical protein
MDTTNKKTAFQNKIVLECLFLVIFMVLNH